MTAEQSHKLWSRASKVTSFVKLLSTTHLEVQSLDWEMWTVAVFIFIFAVQVLSVPQTTVPKLGDALTCE